MFLGVDHCPRVATGFVALHAVAVYPKTRDRRAIYVHKANGKLTFAAVEPATQKKHSGHASPSLYPSRISRSHMHMHTLVKRPPVIAAGVGMSVLHSDGETMTMAHYPLPEEWMGYIQR